VISRIEALWYGTIEPTPFTHGFIYSKGSLAQLDYPNADATELAGISNAGTIVGNESTDGTTILFIYANGLFKFISPPNTASSSVTGMSLRLGLIVGIAKSNSGHQGFIAKCN